MTKKGGLGRGLGALIPGESAPPPGGLSYIPIEQIVPNPRQPRLQMDATELEGLAASIREHGILQPLVVEGEPGDDHFTLIAGERRLRAAKIAGLDKVPALIRHVNDQERLELALIENIQRAELSPLETAEAYDQLADVFALRHEDIATRVGKSRESVSNTLRLLRLPEEVKQALRDQQISEGHARALLGLGESFSQIAVLKTILEKKLSVRQTEELVRAMGSERPARKVKPQPAADVLEIEERLRGRLGTKVNLNHSKKGGSLVIFYYSDEELENLVSQILREG